MPVNTTQPLVTPRTPAPTTPSHATSPAAAAGPSCPLDGVDAGRPGVLPRKMPQAAPAPGPSATSNQAPGFFERLGTAVEAKLALGTKKLLQAQQACVAFYHQALEQLAGFGQFLTGLGAFINESVVQKFRPTPAASPEKAPDADG